MPKDTSPYLSALHRLSQNWAHRLRPADWPRAVPVRRLPRPGYQGDNPYNGFTGAQRRRGEQVLQVLRRNGVLPAPERCALCDTTGRITYHAEDYFDPFALVSLCFPCHMALHARFKSPDRWRKRLDANANTPRIAEFEALPMEEPDFASWLRANTPGPHDQVAQIWGAQEVPDYRPRKPLPDYARALTEATPTETEITALRVLAANPGETSARLTALMGAQGNSAWHLIAGKLCRRLEPVLGPAPTTTERRDADGKLARFYIGLIAKFDAQTRGFTLKPGAAEAITSL